ncbi:MAG: barstar family protein, partial [Thermoanaerobaculia bacterium]
MPKSVFEIDGGRINNLEDFVVEIRSALHIPWNGNLDAFNDYLRGGMGTPDGGFVLRWANSDRSRVNLG